MQTLAAGGYNYGERSKNAQTTEKKETVMIGCSEMRIEGTSRLHQLGMLTLTAYDHKETQK